MRNRRYLLLRGIAVTAVAWCSATAIATAADTPEFVTLGSRVHMTLTAPLAALPASTLKLYNADVAMGPKYPSFQGKTYLAIVRRSTADGQGQIEIDAFTGATDDYDAQLAAAAHAGGAVPFADAVWTATDQHVVTRCGVPAIEEHLVTKDAKPHTYRAVVMKPRGMPMIALLDELAPADAGTAKLVASFCVDPLAP
jgi:hypothetical protein